MAALSLQAALTSRIVIEQAKGVLAERLQIGVDEAFAVLRGGARSRNMLLPDVAREVAGSSSGAADVMRLIRLASGRPRRARVSVWSYCP